MSRDWEVRIRWNVKLFYLINSKRFPALDRFYRWFFYMGKSYSLPIYLVMFLLVGVEIDGFIHLALSMLITGTMMPLLKYTFRHKRPSSLLPNVNLLEPVSLKSFPSADSAYVSTILSVSLFYSQPILSTVLVILTALVGYGRVYMGAHFPLDVIVGFICGFVAAVAGLYIKGLF